MYNVLVTLYLAELNELLNLILTSAVHGSIC